MKEVKQFSKSYILISALYVVLGIVLLAWPSTSLRMICYGLGFVMIVLGITYGIIYFTKENLAGFLQMDLVIGIVCLAFGVFILLNPTFLATVLPFAMGIILLLGAIVKIQSAVNMRRLRFTRWYAVLICALVIIALGIILLCNPFEKERHMILYIGICLILDGMTNLVTLIFIQMRVKSLVKIQKEYPQDDLSALLEHQNQKKKSPPAADVTVSVDTDTEKRQE
ncbi:MAG TPA: DUF308 domain-containing protein [Candidatus Choladousia intestinipullorum]|nr:DUF308 domain-containing protein [Candidatus Choladousia intestinipullorum]